MVPPAVTTLFETYKLLLRKIAWMKSRARAYARLKPSGDTTTLLSVKSVETIAARTERATRERRAKIEEPIVVLGGEGKGRGNEKEASRKEREETGGVLGPEVQWRIESCVRPLYPLSSTSRAE
jgi:hypothetical protein